MNILVDVFDLYRLILNEDKTETMIFDPDIDAESDYPKNLIEINGFQIKNVQKFRFLGSHIKFNEVSTGEHEINIRLEAAKCKFVAWISAASSARWSHSGREASESTGR